MAEKKPVRMFGALKDYKIKGKTVKFDKFLYDNMMEIVEMIKLKFDGVILFDGMEGSGKSEIAMQCCLIVDPTFTEADVFYSVEQFDEWLDNAPPGKAGLWDEFVLAGLSTEALSKMQNLIIKKFTMIRKKALFIGLVIPYIFMLRKYFAVARTRCLIHTSTKGRERGYFKFYTYSQKQWIFNYGHKTWLYSPKAVPAFEGRFRNWSGMFINDDIVQEKKDAAIRSITEDVEAIKLTPKVIEALVLGNCITNNWNNKEEKTKYNQVNKLQKQLTTFPLPKY